MDIKVVTDSISVADQVTSDDLLTLKNAGYGTIICNRPDAEGVEQPTAESLAERATELGLHWHWLPITPGQFTDAEVAKFAGLLELAERQQESVLAFCRTGTRSITLWALSQAAKVPSARLVQQASAAGYDLSGLAPRLDGLFQG
ncbi:TIGR01244 family sulfur transferase [Oceanisphaera sp. W20_SRM_FM3]|uniref:TIGR01244 family sulfur transferase n=1 Tax=Oceanisphaera sp. W20_SRM_FM3 TaxID=3240267 RepID=UPI003F991F3A